MSFSLLGYFSLWIQYCLVLCPMVMKPVMVMFICIDNICLHSCQVLYYTTYLFTMLTNYPLCFCGISCNCLFFLLQTSFIWAFILLAYLKLNIIRILKITILNFTYLLYSIFILLIFAFISKRNGRREREREREREQLFYVQSCKISTPMSGQIKTRTREHFPSLTSG